MLCRFALEIGFCPAFFLPTVARKTLELADAPAYVEAVRNAQLGFRGREMGRPMRAARTRTLLAQEVCHDDV
jgi:hypothetical protein